MRLIAIAFVLAVVVACVDGCDQKVNPPVVWPPGSDWGTSTWPASCDNAAVCSKLHDLGCPEAATSSSGATCETWIAPYAKIGAVNGACICSAADVATVRTCHVKCDPRLVPTP